MMEKLRTCRFCGQKLTKTNTYSTFWERDNRCKICHIKYMRAKRSEEMAKREADEKGGAFFSFDEDAL